MKHRGYSLSLQRVLTDFGSDHAFAQAHQKLEEHYSITVPDSAPRTITLRHAANIHQEQVKTRSELNKFKLNGDDEPRTIISETDGSMVPIVKPNSTGDRRKKKELFYREARLSLARESTSVTRRYSATFGDTNTAGLHMRYCVMRVGFNKKTNVHCVGDGAPWIAEQVEKQFGLQGAYLIDFYHLCEYLSAAAFTCSPQNKKTWVDEQKRCLKDGRVNEVLSRLRSSVEPVQTKDDEAPVRRCYRYMFNRLDQLGYKAAIEADLPIGSGEIESAHRYIIQKRLKIAGAWWLEANAEVMLNLRTARANDDWKQYWGKLAA